MADIAELADRVKELGTLIPRCSDHPELVAALTEELVEIQKMVTDLFPETSDDPEYEDFVQLRDSTNFTLSQLHVEVCASEASPSTLAPALDVLETIERETDETPTDSSIQADLVHSGLLSHRNVVERMNVASPLHAEASTHAVSDEAVPSETSMYYNSPKEYQNDYQQHMATVCNAQQYGDPGQYVQQRPSMDYPRIDYNNVQPGWSERRQIDSTAHAPAHSPTQAYPFYWPDQRVETEHDAGSYQSSSERFDDYSRQMTSTQSSAYDQGDIWPLNHNTPAIFVQKGGKKHEQVGSPDKRPKGGSSPPHGKSVAERFKHAVSRTFSKTKPSKHSKQPKLTNASSATNSDDLEVDWMIDPYSDLEITERIGEGGFGLVWKGFWKSYNQNVAVKTLKVQNPPADIVDTFRKEASFHIHLQHANIVQCYGIWDKAPAMCMVLEFTSLGNLRNVLEQSHQQPLTWTERIHLAADIASGMAYLHQQNILHGDIKSHNILVFPAADRMVAKITDFGMAKIKHHTYVTTQSTARQGTIAWQPPEAFRCDQPRTLKSDVYSYGMVLYELATNKMPFEGYTSYQIMFAISNGERPLLPQDIPPQLRNIILACWDKEPDGRPDFQQVLKMLQEPQETVDCLGDLALPKLSLREDPPEEFMCPLTLEIMQDPVIIDTGETYDREAIEEWFDKGHMTCPNTGQTVESTKLIPNRLIRTRIREWMEHQEKRVSSKNDLMSGHARSGPWAVSGQF